MLNGMPPKLYGNNGFFDIDNKSLILAHKSVMFMRSSGTRKQNAFAKFFCDAIFASAVDALLIDYFTIPCLYIVFRERMCELFVTQNDRNDKYDLAQWLKCVRVMLLWSCCFSGGGAAT